MQHMINTLRNNSNMLRKKSMFKRERSFLSTKKEYYKAAQGKIDLKKATKEELYLIRQKIIKQRRTENIRAWSIIIILITIILAIGLYSANKAEIKKIQSEEKAEDIYLNEHINEYNYFIEEGDKWIEKKNWNNAIYRYKQAVELFPNEYEANYRLALAYSYNCQFVNKDCETGSALIDRLIIHFPEEENLYALQEVFENNNVL